MTEVNVVRTYLELRSPEEFQPATSVDNDVRVEAARQCPASFYRHLYREVGRDYHWVERLEWTDEELRTHLARPEISVWVMYEAGSPAGYFELQKHPDGSTEIAYFGLLPEFIGRGLGRQLLCYAVEQAWVGGANRVWLHTCTLDDPAALPNYLKRGFKPYQEETYVVTLTPEEMARRKPTP